jgi:3-hydroxymyristoyl/3-hydroxydecanoyl-(acyl carrier protein) dehydratase
MRFLMIDTIIEWQIGEKAGAVKNISLSEDFFDDHFPRMPVMPGVLILEGMAQLGGILLEETLKEKKGMERKALMTIIDKTKFREISKPGDQLFYETQILNYNEFGGRIGAQAYKAGSLIVSTKFTFVFDRIHDQMLKRNRQRLLDFWKEGLNGSI